MQNKFFVRCKFGCTNGLGFYPRLASQRWKPARHGDATGRVADSCSGVLVDLLVSVILAIVGKGKGRVFVLGAAVAAVLADFAVIMLDMD